MNPTGCEALPGLPSEMRAIILHGKEDVRLERVALPELEPGDVLMKVEAALTCGTDLKVYRRGYHAQMIRPPSVFGHEMAGVVAAVRPPVGAAPLFRPGDRIVTANSAPCGACYYCARGQENLCDDLRFINGAYAEYLRVPARFARLNTLPVPAHLSFAEAALTEPLACVIHGFEQTAPRPGDSVVILGLGPIGLLWLSVLRAHGCRVIGVERVAARLAKARELGAEQVIAAATDSQSAPLSLGPQRPIDVVVEATGRAEGWELAVASVRKGGTVQLFGGPQAGARISLDTNRLHYDQITLKSSFHHRPATVRRALALIADGVIRAKDFITAEAALEELPDVLRRMATDCSVIKTCIVPGRRP